MKDHYYCCIMEADQTRLGMDYSIAFFEEVTHMVTSDNILCIDSNENPVLVSYIQDARHAKKLTYVLLVPSTEELDAEDFKVFINVSVKLHGMDRFLLSKFVFVTNDDDHIEGDADDFESCGSQRLSNEQYMDLLKNCEIGNGKLH